MTGGYLAAGVPDISECDQEPIHLINAIQPHGALLVVEEPGLIIRQASANAGDFFGIPVDSLCGAPLERALGRAPLAILRRRIGEEKLAGNLAHLACLDPGPRGKAALDVFGNRTDGLLLLEFERTCRGDPRFALESLRGLRDATQRLQRSEGLGDFLRVAVREIRAFSGFERVMAYRFAPDGSGEVVAEDMAPGLASYLGLHYPASDIPEPARRLFALLPLRHLPDVDYAPVPLRPDRPYHEADRPVDLGYCFSRSVSRMYSIYLRNMGVRATLVMPVPVRGRLWGLISCMHHSGPLYLPYERRIPLEALGQLIAPLLAGRAEMDQLQYRNRLDQALGRHIHALGRAETLAAALLEGDGHLLSALDAEGAALLADGGITVLGQTPGEEAIVALAAWLDRRDDEVFATHRLMAEHAPANTYRHLASGVLTLRLSRHGGDRILWFRPEILTEVTWAGDPGKPVELAGDGLNQRLMPRASFSLWKETVDGQSRPWLDCEHDYAMRLRRAILDMMVERAWHLARVNAELQARNLELDSFTYAASHDMKEPLRGIHNMIEFLLMEERDSVSDQGRARMQTVLRLARRMTALLDSLLQYSRAGRCPLEPREVPMAGVIDQAIEVISHALPRESLEFSVQPGLPIVRCDRIWVGTIFQNLIGNAVKYNESPVKRIEIGCDVRQDPPVFFVRDNGIGIAGDDRERLFDLFRRLHDRNAYGEGAGAGLTIVRKAVERHGGQIWIESTQGQGSTFHFTLAPAPAP